MKLKYTALFFFLVFALSSQSQAQTTEFKVSYTMDITGDNLDPMAKAMMDGMVTTIFQKDGKLRTEAKSSMSNTVAIIDGENKKGVVLMNMFGMKMAIPMDEAEFDEKENNSLAPQDIKHTGKTKTIAGYKCKQVIGTSSDGDKLEFWYTDALHLVAKGADYSIPGIKGLPLEMDIVQEGMKIKMTATEVSTDKLDSGLFSTEIPAGYKETNMENMGGMMGK